MLHITRYSPNHPQLKRIIDFIWALTSDGFETVCHKLLPVTNTDLIINLSTPIFYSFEGEKKELADNVHLRLIKTKPQYIFQEGIIRAWGVSIFPYGVYPLLQSPVDKLEGRVIQLSQHDAYFASSLIQAIESSQNLESCAKSIEQLLLNRLVQNQNEATLVMLEDFIANIENETIQNYCEKHGIHIRRLERLMKRYSGVSPKQIQMISRFQSAGNHLIYDCPKPELTDLTYLYSYSDQTHFVKEFKNYSGVTPTDFLREKNSVKGLLK